jgi:predicted small lipoprotein YifL
MKRVLVSAAAILALAACGKKPASTPDAATAAAPAAAAPQTASMTPPERKAGLWEQKISTAGMTQVSRICISDAVNKKVTLWGQQGGEETCSQQSITPTAGGWKFASTCNMGTGGTIVSSGEAKGDFGTHYTVDIKSSTTGAAAPQMNGPHAMTLEATWKGPCPANFKPGDMELPGGMKLNMLTMGAGGASAGPNAEQMAAMRKAMAAAKEAEH